MAEATRGTTAAWPADERARPGWVEISKLKLPATISVVVIGGAALNGCTGNNPEPTDNPDGGPRLCPVACGLAREADGGILRTADGGVQCFC